MENSSINLIYDIYAIREKVKHGTVISLDFESANQSKLSICELGITVSKQGVIGERIHNHFKPLIPGFGPWQKKNLKYKEKFLSDKPSILDFKDKIYSIISESDLIIAHHYETEISVFDAFYYEYGWPSVDNKDWSCTFKLAKKYIKDLKSYSLKSICKELNIDIDAHDALSDSTATMNIIYNLIEGNPKQTESQLSLFNS